MNEAFKAGAREAMEKIALSIELKSRAAGKALDKAMAVDMATASPDQARYATKKVDQAMKFSDGVFKDSMKKMTMPNSAPVKVTPKPPMKMPTGKLGLGAAGIGVMALGAMSLARRQSKLQQPPKPQRY